MFITLVPLALTACAEMPLPDDAVRDAPTAIRLAKIACADELVRETNRVPKHNLNPDFIEQWKQQVQRADWQAKLKDRVWTVWVGGGARGCHDLEVGISAARGDPTYECGECVVVT